MEKPSGLKNDIKRGSFGRMLPKDRSTRKLPKSKLCSHCGEVKSSDAFYLNKALEDGLAQMCKPCMNSYLRKRAKEKEVLNTFASISDALLSDNENQGYIELFALALEKAKAGNFRFFEMLIERANGKVKEKVEHSLDDASTKLVADSNELLKKLRTDGQ